MNRVEFAGKSFRTLAIVTAVHLAFTAPATAQPRTDNERVLGLEEIIVTARRREERLQEVPISMTVFNQRQIADLNMIGTADIGTFTPSLTTNTRFGSDNSTFAIRGFVQELRTTASVGVYFADVVAPRGGPSTPSADGAGPGYLYDLQSVQVLKGPQGTLFGRNTTGGAVMIVPNKPTDEFEGYGEVSVGNYEMLRTQAVVNVPWGDRVRLRAGLDQTDRDGYLENSAPVGPRKQGDIDYISSRLSLVIDITDKLENYTIAAITDSENKATTAPLIGCVPEGEPPPGPGAVLFGPFCRPQVEEYGIDFYTYQSRQPDTVSRIEQQQYINTTTWEATQAFTVKNILAYSENESTLRTGVFGTDWVAADGNRLWFSESGQAPGYPTAHMSTLVEELQFQGNAGKLTWQSGLYYEKSEPEQDSATEIERYGICAEEPGLDPSQFMCQASFPLHGVSISFGDVQFENKAVYGQATWEFDERFAFTGGARYTWDDTDGYSDQKQYGGFPADHPGPPTTASCVDTSLDYPDCRQEFEQDSDEPTWVLELDYTPNDDILHYGKYTRGYRQGSINIFGAPGFQTHEPETVDAWEIGSKLSFSGAVPGIFNVAAFYNELDNMQIQTGFRGAVNTTGITNAGQATIWGVEVETNLALTEKLRLDVSYAYLNTNLDEYQVPDPIPGFDVSLIPSAVEGDDLPLTPENALVAGLTYLLPVPSDLGEMSIGGNWVYTDEALASTTSAYGIMPDYNLFNFNLNWRGIGGTPLDVSAFVTNAFDEEYTTYVHGLYASIGSEFHTPGVPRMYGARVRYNF